MPVISTACFLAIMKNFSNLYPWSSHVIDKMMAANHTFFEKDKIFRFHVSTFHLEQLVAVAVAEGMFNLYSIDTLVTRCGGGGGERAPGTHCLHMRIIILKAMWRN